MSTPTLSIDEVLERPQMGAYRWWLYLACGFLMSLEGYDAYVVSNLAAVIAKDMAIPIPQMAFVFSAQAAGMALGFYTIPLLADKIGRRMIIVIGSLVFGLLTLASTLATNLEEFTIVRFLAFASLGGTMPNIVALVTEYVPTTARGKMITWLFVAHGLGASAAGFIGTALVEKTHSWHAAFWAGGALLLAFIPFLFFFFPESVRFLALRNPSDPRVGRLLRRIDRSIEVTPDTTYVTAEVPTKGLPLVSLFQQGRGAMTLLLWLAMGAALCATATITAWLPVYLHLLGGLDTSTATRMSAVSALGAVTGPILLTVMMKIMRMPLALCLISLGGWITMSMLPFVAQYHDLGWVLGFCFGFLVIGAQAGLNSLVASSYPTSIRSTGIGWAGGIGRLTSMVGPALGGMMLAAKWGPWKIYPAIAAPCFVAAIACLLFYFIVRPAPAQTAPKAD